VRIFQCVICQHGSFAVFRRFATPHFVFSIRLIVSATKPGTELYGYAIVYIELEDENDNSPIFAQKKYATHVWEERAENLYVTAVSSVTESEAYCYKNHFAGKHHITCKR